MAASGAFGALLFLAVLVLAVSASGFSLADGSGGDVEGVHVIPPAGGEAEGFQLVPALDVVPMAGGSDPVAIISPRGGHVGFSTNVSIRASDGSGIDASSIKLYWKGALLHQYSVASECAGSGVLGDPYLCSWAWNTTDADGGASHLLELHASDPGGGSHADSVIVYVDRVRPVVYPASIVPSDGRQLYDAEPFVNFTVSAGSQGLVNKSSIWVKLDNSTALDFYPESNCSLIPATSDYFCSFRISRQACNQLGYVFNSSLLLGGHSLAISASDLAGNEATPASVNFTLLDGNDTLSISTLVADKPSAVATGSDYWQYTFRISIGPSAGTRVSLRLSDWSDGFGHSIPAAYANLTVGSERMPVANSYLYSLPVSDDDALAPGVQTSLVLRQYIPAGTVSNQYFTSYGVRTVDSESPSLQSTTPANNSFLTYVSNVTAVFSDSGGSGIYLDGSAISLSDTSGIVPGGKDRLPPNALRWNFSSPLADGNYTIATQPVDSSGNSGPVQYSYFILDRVAPTAAVLNVLPEYTTSLRVSLGWSGGADDRSGVSHYQVWRGTFGNPFVNIANASGTAYNDTAVSDGVLYYYNLSTVDRSGNVRLSTTIRWTTIDITAPSQPVLSQPATPTNNPAITVSGTADANSNISLYVNGALERVTFSSTGSFTFNGVPLSEGVNILNATATDLGGLVSQASAPVSVLLDTAPPTIGSLYPPDGSNTSSAAPEISALFNESGSGINSSSIIMLLNSLQVAHSYNAAAKRVYYTPSPLSEGAQNVSLFARDLAANPSALVAWSFGVDLTPPPIVSGLVVSQDTNATMNLSWAASAAPDFAAYRIYRRQILPFSNVASATLVNGSVASTGYRDSGLLPSMDYYYAVTAVDKVGNENATVVSAYNRTIS